jgi:rubrerythrin
MTDEEAIARIRDHMIIHKMDEPRAIYISEALEKAIKALEQHPDEDCISRQKALDCFEQTNTRQGAKHAIETLPSVTPQRPEGRWIATENEEMNIDGYFCSCCDLPMETEERTDYCPNCGAKMSGGGEE